MIEHIKDGAAVPETYLHESFVRDVLHAALGLLEKVMQTYHPICTQIFWQSRYCATIRFALSLIRKEDLCHRMR